MDDPSQQLHHLCAAVLGFRYSPKRLAALCLAPARVVEDAADAVRASGLPECSQAVDASVRAAVDEDRGLQTQVWHKGPSDLPALVGPQGCGFFLHCQLHAAAVSMHVTLCVVQRGQSHHFVLY
jgi:hypothetical protein